VDLVGIIARAIAKIIESSLYLIGALMAMLESGLRAPLDQAGVKGWLQTLIVALVPALTLVAAVKLLHRIIRVVVVALVLGFLLYVLWPVGVQLWMISRGLK